jgi:tape measure domain-containing protein
MATIRNSISLQDRMTPVFRSIIKSMDSTLRVMRNLDRQANKGTQSKAYRTAERDIKRANNELIRMQNNLSRADKAAGKLATTTGKVSTNMSRMGSGGLNLGNLAAGLYLLKNIANTLSGIMETPDTMKAIQYRLDTYDTTALSGDQLFDAAYLAAQRSRSELASTANLASRILVSGATNGSGAEAINLAELLNKASFLGGSSSGESQRALLQLSQALASGTLQGDELRAIREQAPGLTDVLARGLSSMAERGALPEKFIGTTMGDLKALGAEGELTAGRVIAAFKEMGTYVNETFDKSPKQFGQAVTGIANVWKRWLKLMSQGDNALSKINEKAWQLLEWFESTDGQAFMEGLAKGINFVVDAIMQFIDWIGQLINWFRNLENASNILQAVFIALATVAAAAAVYMAVKWIAAWIAAAWPVLLVIALLAIVIYALLQCGVTANEIVGAIAGAIMFLGYVIYDIVVWLVNIVYWAVALVWDALVGLSVALINIVIGAGMLIGLVLQGIVQIILWVITTIWAALVTIYNVVYSIVKGAWGVIKGAIVGIYQLFVWLGQGVLGILYGIASAIDFIFGSNLAATVGGWIDGLGQSVDDLNAALDPFGEFEDIGNQWSSSYGDLGDMYAGNGKYDDWNITDNMADLWNGATDLMGEFGKTGVDMMLDPTMLDQWALDNTLNPMDGWDRGYNFGSGLVDDIGGLDFNGALGDLSNIEDMLNNGVDVGGGDLDSVGSIKSDVDISDEDIQLLRDISARDFLLNLQTITPQANVTFGDVRETADVNKLLDVIQDMVDEQLATSLVVE